MPLNVVSDFAFNVQKEPNTLFMEVHLMHKHNKQKNLEKSTSRK